MPLDFTAIDFETANPASASACAVGLVKVRDGIVVDRAAWLIRPPAPHDWFSPWNERVHGITAADVIDAAEWVDQWSALMSFVDGDVFVAHNAGFDMGVIKSACEATELPMPGHDYVCSLQVARRTYELDSYRLPVAAAAAGFSAFRHHDALSDSEACAAIMIDAARRTGVDDIGALASTSRVRVRRLGSTVSAEPAVA